MPANPPQVKPTRNDRVMGWMRARAAADPQMSAAAARHPAEPSGSEGGNISPDVVVVLTRDHNQVHTLVQQLQALPGHKAGGTAEDAAKRKSLVDMIAARLPRHEAAEAEALWPAVRQVLPDGDAWADRAAAQEAEASKTLAALGTADPASGEFDSLVEQFATGLRKHVAVEAQVFLLLRDTMPEGDREKLGHQVLEAKKREPAQPAKREPSQPGTSEPARPRQRATRREPD